MRSHFYKNFDKVYECLGIIHHSHCEINPKDYLDYMIFDLCDSHEDYELDEDYGYKYDKFLFYWPR
jgi:hypothetical protein